MAVSLVFVWLFTDRDEVAMYSRRRGICVGGRDHARVTSRRRAARWSRSLRRGAAPAPRMIPRAPKENETKMVGSTLLPAYGARCVPPATRGTTSVISPVTFEGRPAVLQKPGSGVRLPGPASRRTRRHARSADEAVCGDRRRVVRLDVSKAAHRVSNPRRRRPKAMTRSSRSGSRPRSQSWRRRPQIEGLGPGGPQPFTATGRTHPFDGARWAA